jgi:hypothetical protein
MQVVGIHYALVFVCCCVYVGMRLRSAFMFCPQHPVTWSPQTVMHRLWHVCRQRRVLPAKTNRDPTASCWQLCSAAHRRQLLLPRRVLVATYAAAAVRPSPPWFA